MPASGGPFFCLIFVATQTSSANTDKVDTEEQPTMKYLTCMALTISLTATVSAEIYRSTDSQGNPVFSDTPQKGGQRIDLPPPNTTPAVTPETKPPAPEKPAASEDIPAISITQPADGAVLANGLMGADVSLSLDRPLPPGYQIEFRLDGKVLQKGRQTHTSIPHLNRGQRLISARLLDPKNRVIHQDESRITVYWPNN